MIDGIKWLFSNWWSNDGIMWSYMIYCIGVMMCVWLFCSLTYISWKNAEDSNYIDAGFWDIYIVISLFLVPLGTFMVFITLPIILLISPIVLFFYLYYKLMTKWGQKYYEVKKSQENQRLTALAQLIKDDPTVAKAYEKIMRDTVID